MGWTRRAALAAGIGASVSSTLPAWPKDSSDRIEIVIGKTGQVFARTRVNGKDVHALLDNTHPTVINIESSLLSAGERSSIQFGSQDFVILRAPPTYRFGGTDIAVGAAMRGVSKYSETMGFTVDLILGKSVFQESVVELDFRRQAMWLHRADRFKTPNNAVLFGDGDADRGMRIPVRLGDDVSGLAAVSLRFFGYIRVSDPKMYDWFREGISLNQREVTTVLGSVSVKASEDMFQSPPLTVGNWDFGSVTAWVDTDPQPGVVGTLGVAALRTFKVWLDQSHGRIWMRPQARFSRASTSPGSQSR